MLKQAGVETVDESTPCLSQEQLRISRSADKRMHARSTQEATSGELPLISACWSECVKS